MPEHEWSGSKLRFQKPGGGWGAFVELCGPKGANGASGGFYSRPSGVGFDPTQLPLATTAVPAEFLVQQDGMWVRATHEQMKTWLGGTVTALVDAVITEAGDTLVTEAGDAIIQG